MIKQYNILIIEDHPLIIEAYKNVLLNISSKNDKLKFNIDIANDCDTAFYKIEKAVIRKNDLDPKELILAIETVIKNLPYYSKTVIELMRKLTTNDFYLDEFDRKILYELSKGCKMSELSNMIPLSVSAIEKRKRVLKEVFNVKNDRNLIKVAEEKGFI